MVEVITGNNSYFSGAQSTRLVNTEHGNTIDLIVNPSR